MPVDEIQKLRSADGTHRKTETRKTNSGCRNQKIVAAAAGFVVDRKLGERKVKRICRFVFFSDVSDLNRLFRV